MPFKPILSQIRIKLSPMKHSKNSIEPFKGEINVLKKLFVFTILFFLLSACSKEKEESSGHFSIYGLGLGASVDEVTSELGIPEDKQVLDLGEEANYVIYSYHRLYLGFHKEKLVLISSIDPEFSTTEGISIHDDKRNVLLKYKKEDIYCQQCNPNDFNYEEMPPSLSVEDGNTRLVFGGEGLKKDLIQVGRDIPEKLMFVHTMNPLEDTSEIQSAKLDKKMIKKLTDQFSNYRKIAEVRFTKDLTGEELREKATQGTLPGFPFSIGTSYNEIIDTLGAPDDKGGFGEGSYNLIYWKF